MEARYSLIHLIFLIENRQSAKNLKCHLMTRSARAKTFGGIVRPICLAALRLTMNSNFFGCSTGESAGLAAFQDLVNINGRSSIQVGKVHAVTHKAAGFHFFYAFVYRR